MERYTRYSKKENSFSFFYNEMLNLNIVFSTITPQKLLELLHINSTKNSLYLFSTVFAAKNYWFSYYEGSYYLNKFSGLQEIVISILKSSKFPMEISKILKIIKLHYPTENKYEEINSVIGNIKLNDNIYELDKHVFGLIEHFNYPQNEWVQITNDTKIIMEKIGRQTNAVELLNPLKENYPKLRSKYELVYIIRSDNEIEDLGFFNFALKSMGLDERITVKNAIKELFKANPNPKHFSEVQKEISHKRFLRIEGMGIILKAQDYLKSYLGGFWGLKEYNEKNLFYLAGSELYITKIANYETFPDTSLDRILNIFGDNSFEQKILFTIQNSKQLKVYNGVETEPFVISESWSIVKIVRCILFNIKREIYWDELLWIVKDFNLVIDNNSKSKIKSDKNVIINGNKLSYFESSLKKNDMEDVAEICYETLVGSVKQESIENIYEILNNEYIEITKDELLHLIKNDDRFLLINEKLIMVK